MTSRVSTISLELDPLAIGETTCGKDPEERLVGMTGGGGGARRRSIVSPTFEVNFQSLSTAGRLFGYQQLYQHFICSATRLNLQYRGHLPPRLQRQPQIYQLLRMPVMGWYAVQVSDKGESASDAG